MVAYDWPVSLPIFLKTMQKCESDGHLTKIGSELTTNGGGTVAILQTFSSPLVLDRG